jgi:phage gp29-like protein
VDAACGFKTERIDLMAEYFQGLVDARGRPIEKATLTEEMGGPTMSGVRSPTTGYPGDGLDPVKLAHILKEADQGNPLRYLELAETIEERDPHLVGVLGTRKRSVAQLEITVEPGSDDPEHIKHADMVREWVKRDELGDELFDMLDAIGKGYSFTEIIWGREAGHEWYPVRLEWRDPRWFDFELWNLTQPRLITESGQRELLPPGKFIYLQMKAKSGIPARGGLMRNIAWAWMFKAYSNRDAAIFSQNYGQPIRVGKYGPGASDKDKAALLRAISLIGGDMAAMIPQSMMIEFIEAGNVTASADLYERRMAFMDQQVSKAVLGQTATTDAIAGGHAVGQEHRQVQEDIERADAKKLAGVINRDLVRVWIQLEYGPQTAYPRVRIGRPESKDIKAITETVIALGLPIRAKDAYELTGLAQPDAGDEVIIPGRAKPAAPEATPPGTDPQPPPNAQEAKLALQSEQLATLPRDPGITDAARTEKRVDRVATRAQVAARPAMNAMIDLISGIVTDPNVQSMEDVRTRLLTLAPAMPTKDLARAMREALAVAELTGRQDLADE